ncbi:MAG: hypothetical protein N3F67_00540 [Acidilobaceae archaeon]|nr:hypothetical protein [Acidilobaceae archaeon]
MYRLKLKAFVPEIMALPSLLLTLSARLSAAGCSVVRRPSWVLAACGEVLVKASIYTHAASRPPIELEGSLTVSVEGPDPRRAVELAEAIASSLEGGGAGVALQE